jgi:hypothetical protein
MSNLAPDVLARPRHARVFAEKAARTIIEVQDNINSVADIAFLLEVSGITKKDLRENGFGDMYSLAVYISDFIDFHEIRKRVESEAADPFLSVIPSLKTRLVESLALTFPWSGTMTMLYISGISLWMASGLSAPTLTALILGAFLGIFITEGPWVAFQRPFLLSYSQLNICEAKRTVRRNLYVASLLTVASAFVLFLFGYLTSVPTGLVLVSVVALTTVSLHRASYMIIYALKKSATLVVSYATALALLLVTFTFASPAIPDPVVRYLVALGVAFVSLSAFAVHAHYKIFGTDVQRLEDYPSFYRPPTATKETIKARVSTQLWESLPYHLFRSFFFVMMFGDRLTSWFFNPALLQGQRSLPLLFNTAYHSGADPATLIFALTSLVQYVIMAPIFHEVSNFTLEHGITQIGMVKEFLKKRYRNVMVATIATSCTIAVGVNLVAQSMVRGSEVGLKILEVASIGNVFLCIFAANVMFAMFLFRIKGLAVISLIACVILIPGSFILAQGGFENIVYAYLASSFIAAVLSSLRVTKMMKNAPSLFFARFA